jgi:branched-chain amino acid transport system permease protein
MTPARVQNPRAARPANMSRLRGAIFVVAIIVFAAIPWTSPSVPYQFTIILTSGLATLGVVVLLKAGLISFGHGLFYATGAYAVAYLAPVLHVNALFVVLAATVIAGVLAFVVGLFMVRYRGVFFAMLNLALSMVAYTVLLKFYNLTGGSDGMQIGAMRFFGLVRKDGSFLYVLFYITLALVIVVGWWLTRYLKSPLGWALTAIQNNETRVEYMGKPVRKILLVAYTLSGLLAGLGGAITAVAVGYVDPGFSYWLKSAEFLVIAVLGGVGSVVGAFGGSLIFEMLSINAAQYLTNTWSILLGIVIYAIVRFAPKGLWGLYDALWRPRAAHD